MRDACITAPRPDSGGANLTSVVVHVPSRVLSSTLCGVHYIVHRPAPPMQGTWPLAGGARGEHLGNGAGRLGVAPVGEKEEKLREGRWGKGHAALQPPSHPQFRRKLSWRMQENNTQE